jgi:Ca-activated chloride channel family protein
MRWESPWLLLLLVFVPLALIVTRGARSKRPAVLWVRTKWDHHGIGFRALLVRSLEALPWLALTLALLSLGRPQQGVRQSEVETRGVDIMLALDISPSMAAEDFRPENRLAVALHTAREFVRQRPHDRVGVVAFAGTSFIQCPLTLDHDSLEELLMSLDFGLAEDGTAVGMGLATAVQGLRTSKTPSRMVVLLTDGQSNRGAIDPGTAADLASAMGVKVYTVLVGRGGVVPVPVEDPILGRRTEMVRMDVDESSLREIAKRTKGKFFRATDPAALAGIYNEIDQLERAPIRSLEYQEYLDLGPMLLGAAALLLGVYSLASTTLAFRLP